MKKVKQIIAIIAIALLAGLYIATLITAIFAKEHAATAFALCLILTFVIPLMAFITILFFGRAFGKKVIGDPKPLEKEDENEEIPDESGNEDSNESGNESPNESVNEDSKN